MNQNVAMRWDNAEPQQKGNQEQVLVFGGEPSEAQDGGEAEWGGIQIESPWVFWSKPDLNLLGQKLETLHKLSRIHEVQIDCQQ